MMFRGLPSWTIVLSVIAFSCNVFAATYDDFSSSFMSRTKWDTLEEGVQIVNNQLQLSLRNPGDGENEMVSISLVNPDSVNSMQCDMAMENFSLVAGQAQDVYGGIAGVFYQSASGRDVVASLSMEQKAEGNPATIRFMAHLMYFDTFEDIKEQQFTMTLAAGQTATLAISYDGDTTFTFQAGPAAGFPVGAEMQVLDAEVARGGTPLKGLKILNGGVWNQGDVQDITPHFLFDNVVVNGAPYDYFNTPLHVGEPNVYIDPAKWIQDLNWPGQPWSDFSEVWGSRRIDGGRLELIAQNSGLDNVTFNTQVPQEAFSNFFQADVAFDPSSKVSSMDAGNALQVRLDGWRFNDTHDGSAANPYDGEVGEIGLYIRTELYANGATKARATVYRCGNADCTTDTVLFSEQLGCDVVVGMPNTLTMERSGNLYTFTCDDQSATFEYTGLQYESQWGSTHRIRGRINNTASAYGYLKAYVDNMATKKNGILSFMTPILSSRQSQD